MTREYLAFKLKKYRNYYLINNIASEQLTYWVSSTEMPTFALVAFREENIRVL